MSYDMDKVDLCPQCGTMKHLSIDTGLCGRCHPDNTQERRTNRTHGMAGTPTYQSYMHMKDRCTNPKSNVYSYYGERGIRVCDRWLESFQNFLDDMGVRPEGTSLDRIDNNGDYEPDNCRWADWNTQHENRRNTIRYEGKTTREWADALGIDILIFSSLVNRRGIEYAVKYYPTVSSREEAKRLKIQERIDAGYLKPECLKGHKMTFENIKYTSRGSLGCNACFAQYGRDRRTRQKELAKLKENK